MKRNHHSPGQRLQTRLKFHSRRTRLSRSLPMNRSAELLLGSLRNNRIEPHGSAALQFRFMGARRALDRGILSWGERAGVRANQSQILNPPR
jgi:hypothetical protein